MFMHNAMQLAAAEGLSTSFEDWLSAMSLASAPLGAEQLARLGLLWRKAQEAAQLQSLVDSLKQSELELAAHEAEDVARHMDALVGGGGVGGEASGSSNAIAGMATHTSLYGDLIDSYSHPLGPAWPGHATV